MSASRRTMRTWYWWVGAALILVAAILFTAGPPPPVANPPGTFVFAALGDAPYYPWEERQYRTVLQDLDAHDLAWVLHTGDIWWRPCTEDMYLRAREWMNGLRHPVVYTPGDNEWSDCWEPGSGEFAPLDRLQAIRRIFFEDPAHTLGGRAMSVTSQAGAESLGAYVENVRWSYHGIVFATVNLPGSANAEEPFPARSDADDAECVVRLSAAASWLRGAFREAQAEGATAVVIAFHAAPGLVEPLDDPYRHAYDPFLEVLEDEAERFQKPVLIVHGDDHVYTVDHPLTNRVSGRPLDNVTRLQVPGSPEVGWVRIVVTPGPEPTFAFQKRSVPRWKYW